MLVFGIMLLLCGAPRRARLRPSERAMPTRREFVQSGVVFGGAIAGLGACASSGAAGGAAGTSMSAAPAPAASGKTSSIKQSVCKWCYGSMTVDELSANAKRIGLVSVELLDPADFDTVTKHGLVCAMTNAPGDPRTRIPKGFNRVGEPRLADPALRRGDHQGGGGEVPERDLLLRQPRGTGRRRGAGELRRRR